MADLNETRLRRVADEARHHSVTPQNLALQTDSGIIFSKKWLSNPVISYLDIPSEQPHVIIKSREQVKINGEEVGESEYGAVLVITDQRFRLLIGQEKADRTISVPFLKDIKYEIKPVEPETWSLTDDSFEIEFWIRHKMADIGIKPSTELTSADISTIAETIDEVEESIDWIGAQWWAKRIQKRNHLYEIAENTQSETVTACRLAPIYPYLDDGEIPEYILHDGELVVGIEEGKFDESTVRPHQEGSFAWVTITEKRILAATGDEVESLPYSDIDSVSVLIEEQPREYADEPREISYIEVWVEDFAYLIEADDLTDVELRQAIRFMRNQR